MFITVSKLDNVTELRTVSAISTFGTGFLTSFVSTFIELFGIENTMLANKMEKAKYRAIQSLIDQARATPEASGIMNLSFQLSGKAVLAYGTVYHANASNNDTGSSSSNEIPEI